MRHSQLNNLNAELHVVDGSGGPGVLYDGPDSPTEPERMPDDVVVTARYRSAPSNDGGFSLSNFFIGRDYGQGASNPDPFRVASLPGLQLAPHEIVARTVESLTLALKAVVNTARPVLREAEEKKLDLLVDSLDKVAKGLKAGDLNPATARSLIESSLSVAFDTFAGETLGVFFSGIGAWASTLAPHPALKLLGTLGFGAVGLAADWYISDTAAGEKFAKLLTDGLFNGAQALSNLIGDVVSQIHEGFNFITGMFDPFRQETSLQLESDGTRGNFDGDATNGFEYYVAVTHNGLREDYVLTTNPVMNMPRHWGYGDPQPLPSYSPVNELGDAGGIYSSPEGSAFATQHQHTLEMSGFLPSM